MRKIACASIAFFLFAAVAAAQVPSGNVFFGYSYENTNSTTLDIVANRPNLHGWEASLEGKWLPWIGIVADFSGHNVSESFTQINPGGGSSTINVNGHEQELLFGPRVSIPVGKFTPFAEGMVGLAHIHNGGTLPNSSNTSFASALGGGLDYRLIKLVALRGEGDYIRTNFFNTTQNNLRLSFGIVLRF